MKVCFFGLGSIGKRHLKNFTAVAAEHGLELEIHAYRNTRKILEPEVQKLLHHQIYNEYDLHNDYDVVFITNPTSMHYHTIKLLANKTKHMFIEKPVFDNIDYNIMDLNLSDQGVYYVAGPLKFASIVQGLKDIIKQEKVYSIRAICSSYLPDWRPGVDYRDVYSAKKVEGGGVSIDLIHEWDYITYLFGFPLKVHKLEGKFSHLEIDSEDLAIYIARYDDKLVEIHLDYFGRTRRREIEIFTESGTIIGDFIGNKISFTNGRAAIDYSMENRDMYKEEMRSFLEQIARCAEGRDGTGHAYKVLKLAMGRL